MHEIRHLAASAVLSGINEDPDIRIRMPGVFPLATTPVGDTRRIAIVDTETTGSDPLTDEIIDIAIVVVEVDTLGQIFAIDRVGQALRDPGMPIPAVITRLTGITDDDVRGRTIDLDRLERLLAGADVISLLHLLAHPPDAARRRAPARVRPREPSQCRARLLRRSSDRAGR